VNGLLRRGTHVLMRGRVRVPAVTARATARRGVPDSFSGYHVVMG